MGDLLYGRTVHSLVQLLAVIGAQIYLISPKQLQIPDFVKRQLSTSNTKIKELSQVNNIISELDVLYVTRIQKERFLENNQY